MAPDTHSIAACLSLDENSIRQLQARGHLLTLDLTEREVRQRLYDAHLAYSVRGTPLDITAARCGGWEDAHNMDLVDGYPIIVTDRLRECRDFYGGWFGFQVAFEADWIVVLNSGGDRSITVAFMHSRHPSSPPSPAAYGGDGMFITFQVADARNEFERLVAAGLSCDLDLTDEPWGQRRFGVTDPAGMWVDVVEQIEPAAGWWEPFLAST